MESEVTWKAMYEGYSKVNMLFKAGAMFNCIGYYPRMNRCFKWEILVLSTCLTRSININDTCTNPRPIRQKCPG